MFPTENLALGDLGVILVWLEKMIIVLVVAYILRALLRKKNFIQKDKHMIVIAVVCLWAVAFLGQFAVQAYNYTTYVRPIYKNVQYRNTGL